MPMYDFKCLNCGHEFERNVLSDTTMWDCPKCLYGNAAKRLPSAPAFVLKGSGFHKNDYPKK